MSSSGTQRKQSFGVGAAVRDPYARFVFGLGPHPGLRRRANSAPEPSHQKGLTGPALQLATAGTLYGESLLHRLSTVYKPFAQIGIGSAQRFIGPIGALYYGRKARKEGGFENYAKAFGYGLFGMHGYARMLESPFTHAPYTALTGAGAAASKAVASGPFSFPGFVADLAANVVEYGHSLPHSGPSWKRVVSEFGHQVGTSQLRALQRFGATGLASVAAYDIFKQYQASRKK